MEELTADLVTKPAIVPAFIIFVLEFVEQWYLLTSQAIGNYIDLGVKRYRISNSFYKFKIIIKILENYSEACPYLGLSIGTTLGLSNLAGRSL